jgi:hypothetical protein
MFVSPEDTGEIVSSGAGSFLSFVAVLVSIANMLWSWHTKSQSAAADRVKKLEDRLDHVEDRQISLEGEFKHLPTKDDISALRIQLADVLGKVNVQENSLTAIARTVNRIDDFLREKA